MKSSGKSWHLKFKKVTHPRPFELMHAHNITHDYPLHIHEKFCLAIVLQGTETHICRGKSFQAVGGNLLLINANEAHSSKSVNSEYRVIYIAPAELKSIASEVTGPKSKNLHFPEPVIKDSEIFQSLLDLHLKFEQKASPLETGFFDQSHLSRNFKRITGMTPRYYYSHSNTV